MKRIFGSIAALLLYVPVFAQTNPTAQSLPYSENFSGLAHTSTTYPVGWQGWNTASAPGATYNTAAPTGDRALVASSTASVNSGNIHNYDGKMGFLNNASLDLALALAINTSGRSNIKVSYDVMTIRNPYDNSANTRINEVTLQYRVGTTGSFTSLTGVEYQNNSTLLTTSGSTTPQKLESKDIQLPAACNNQPVVQLRWISRQVSGAGARPSFAVDNISIDSAFTKTVSVAATAQAAEGAVATPGTFTFTFNPATADSVTFNYDITGTAGFGTDYTVSLTGATPATLSSATGSITVPAATSSFTATVTPINDNDVEGLETVIVTMSSPVSDYELRDSTATMNILDDEATRIHTIQGSGSTATPGVFTVEAIVTGIYPTLSPAGFYIQEEDADADADINTSEGIFVVSSATVAVGDKVRVSGTVVENSASPSFMQAVINNTNVAVISSNNAMPATVNISLPVTVISDYEKYECMLVRFPDTLTVTDNFNLGRFGEINLSKGGLVYQPTQIVDPNDAIASGTTSTGTSNLAAINALALSNSLRTILIDDGKGTMTMLPFVNADNTLRIGSTINGVTGILGFAFSVYRIQPIPAAPPVFNYAPRPALPSVGNNANVKVASFNVLNYFNGDGLGGGFPTSRGANSAAEFTRQRDKIINAIAALNADVVGLIEMENDGTGANSALLDLLNGLNTKMGAGTYSFINDGAAIQTYGTDEIRCAIIYKPASVKPVGAVMIGSDSVFNRPPVAQTFTVTSTCSDFTYIINHFKSKGCGGSTGADVDQLDGQSCFNYTRKLQATALSTFINNVVIPASGNKRVVSMGDYNSYFEEDPLDVFRASGYTVLGTATTFSYLFSGQVGTLDNAIVTDSLKKYVTGIVKWNINSAEPTHLDYNDAINDGGGDFVNQWGATYSNIPFRSSDHDPVLIGLNMPMQNTLDAKIKVVPSNFIYTGGIPTNIYLGYGPQSAKLNTTVTGGTGITYSWYPATNLSCANCQNPVFTPTAAGSYTYTVTATNSKGCTTTESVTFCVKDVRVPRSYSNVYVCLSGHTVSVHVLLVPLVFFLGCNNDLGKCNDNCGNKDNSLADVIEEESTEIRLYPNPATGMFFVEVPSNVGSAEIVVMDMSGKVIAGQSNAQGTVPFNTTNFAKGIYMVQVKYGTGISINKLVIQ